MKELVYYLMHGKRLIANNVIANTHTTITYIIDTCIILICYQTNSWHYIKFHLFKLGVLRKDQIWLKLTNPILILVVYAYTYMYMYISFVHNIIILTNFHDKMNSLSRIVSIWGNITLLVWCWSYILHDEVLHLICMMLVLLGVCQRTYMCM